MSDVTTEDSGGSQEQAAAAAAPEPQEDLLKAFSPENVESLLAEYESDTKPADEPAATQETKDEEEPDADDLVQTGGTSSTDTLDQKIAALRAKYRDDPTELAKAFAHLQTLYGRQSQELGQARKSGAGNEQSSGTSSDAADTSSVGQTATTPDGDGAGAEDAIETLGQYGEDASGFPLDKYGIPVRPQEWWDTQRLEEWIEACDGDVDEATRRRNREEAEWAAQYSAKRTIAEQQALQQRTHAQQQADATKARELQAKQAEEIPRVAESLTAALSKLLPEEGATAATEELLDMGSAIVEEALKSNRVTMIQASDPDMVLQSVGEAMRRLVVTGKLEEFYMKHGKIGGVGTGKPNGAGAVPQPPMTERGGASGSPGASAVPRNGSAAPKVRQSDITDQDRQMAEAFSRVRRTTVTPEEIAAERLGF